MPSAKEKQLRKERILQFIRENRDNKPMESPAIQCPPMPTKKEDTLREKKRVTFNQTKRQRANSDSAKIKEAEKQVGLGLTSCLITKSSDTRITGGANNPAERDVGKLPRTDSECQFKSPGIHFLRERNENYASQEVRITPSKPIRKELKNKCDYFPRYQDNRPFKDQTTQTLYRESSAQTLAYLPEVENQGADDIGELFTLAKLLPGEKAPGLHEVEILERSRRRWLFNNALKDNFRRLLREARKVEIKTKYKAILDAFEWEQWMEREEYIQECQMMRLEIVIKMFDKREKEMHNASKLRIEMACERIEKRRQAGLKKNEIEYQRGMRRIEMQLAKTSRKWTKPTPLQSLGSPCSEFFGPLIRYGVDPARRSFAPTTGHKAFDMRIDDLEKQINMSNVECPFSKLKEWSKPKEYVREYEQNFCNDGNLLRLYESLKILRTQQDQEKEAPKCLKTRLIPENYQYSTSSSLEMFNFNRYQERKTLRQSVHLGGRISPKRTIRPQAPPPPKKMKGREDLEDLINTYEGTYIGSIMQFLSDEMDRLKEQRKLHLFSILAQKERWRRESCEAGLRQKENIMRTMYEEIFQHCNAEHQKSSGEYVENILTTDVAHIIENETAETVTDMARQIDQDIARWLESFKLIQNPLNFVPLRLMLKDMVCPDLDAALRSHEKNLIAQYIVEDVIFPRMWDELDPIDIASTLTSDLIDRLIDNDLYLFSSDSESEGPQKSSWYEAHAIIRKLIRQAVPGQRWNDENETVVTATYNDLFDDIFRDIIFKMENPNPIVSKDLLPLCSSRALMTFTDDVPKRKHSIVEVDDSFVDAKVVSVQLLNLIKKLKKDKITKDLKTDELFVDDVGGSEVGDQVVKTHIFRPIGKRQKVDSKLFNVASSFQVLEHEDLKLYRSYPQSPVDETPEQREEVEVEPVVPEEEEENTEIRISFMSDAFDFNDDPSFGPDDGEHENDEDAESNASDIIIYSTKESQLFNFR